MSYEKAMSKAFAKSRKALLKTGKMPEIVSMIYDCGGMSTASLRKANRELAKSNMVFKRFRTLPGRTPRGFVCQKDLTKPIPRRPYWLVTADTIIFDAGGGAQ